MAHHWLAVASSVLAQDGGHCGSFLSSSDGAAEWFDASWAEAGGHVRVESDNAHVEETATGRRLERISLRLESLL